MFQNIDQDESGSIEITELAEGLESLDIRLTRRELRVFCFDVDRNHDGTLSLGEFLAHVDERRDEDEEYEALTHADAAFGLRSQKCIGYY